MARVVGFLRGGRVDLSLYSHIELSRMTPEYIASQMDVSCADARDLRSRALRNLIWPGVQDSVMRLEAEKLFAKD